MHGAKSELHGSDTLLKKKQLSFNNQIIYIYCFPVKYEENLKFIYKYTENMRNILFRVFNEIFLNSNVVMLVSLTHAIITSKNQVHLCHFCSRL